MSLLILALVGLIAGWLASVIMKTNSSQGVLMDIVFGVLGAVVGGLILKLIWSARCYRV